MKLEMTAYDMDINVTLSDDDTFNVSLDIIQTIRNLVEELRAFSNVNVSITSILVDDYATEFDDEFIEDNSMPPTISMEQINETNKWLIDLCIDYGYNYSARLHINLWGNKRGV